MGQQISKFKCQLGGRGGVTINVMIVDRAPKKYFEEEILSSIVLSISTSIVFSTACYSYVHTFVKKKLIL